MTEFTIHDVSAGLGRIGICPMPGRYGMFRSDLGKVRDWRPDLVLTMTERHELESNGATNIADGLAEFDCSWLHLPIADFNAPTGETLAAWPAASSQARDVLAAKGRVLVHCYGGCGRSGMAVVRIMVEMGEPSGMALSRLRLVRGCAVETEAQMNWAKG